jgi:hypothetical protein
MMNSGTWALNGWSFDCAINRLNRTKKRFCVKQKGSQLIESKLQLMLLIPPGPTSTSKRKGPLLKTRVNACSFNLFALNRQIQMPSSR